ncbi:hypothetical protein FACS1894191_8380 [Clostridia bacterium]|nr:hypothetical protein FACS1894191_8380 [Clostridia bacterium]
MLYTELVKENIAYEDLMIARPYNRRMIDEFIAVIIDALISKSPYVCVDGVDRPRELVKHNLLRLDYGDMEHAINQFEGITERIFKKKQYILTLLYNCKLEMDSHYTNLVRYHQYGGI